MSWYLMTEPGKRTSHPVEPMIFRPRNVSCPGVLCEHQPRAPTFIALQTSKNMRVLSSFVSSLLLSGATIASAASSWSFEDATVSINSKGAEVGAGPKDK